MVKHELRVESLKARVDSLKARVKIQKCEFRSTSYEFKFKFYHVTYAFRSESTLCSCLDVNSFLEAAAKSEV